MGNRVERARKSRDAILVVVSLLMLLAYSDVPALAAQEVAVPNADTASGYQYGPQPGPPVEPEPLVEPGVCGHAPGEFLVVYESEVALRAAPQENVADTIDGILAQLVVYGGIKSEPDSEAQRDAEEAAKQELETRPGVSYVEYNCSVSAEASTFAGAAQAAAARALPADCGECGGNIGRLASEIIGGGSEGSDGKTAYQAALSAARSAGLEENVALASETEGGDAVDNTQAEPTASENGEIGETGGSEESTDDGGNVAEAAAETADTGEEGDASEETYSASGGATPGGADPGDTEDAENASANGGGLGGSPLVALGGGVLLVAGLFIARKVFGG